VALRRLRTALKTRQAGTAATMSKSAEPGSWCGVLEALLPNMRMDLV
jgi:hypothetical protein